MENMFSSGYSMEIYKTIENDFMNYIRYVPLEPESEKIHLEVCSPVLADLLLRICSQIETFFKEWVKLQEFNSRDNVDLVRGKNKNKPTMKDYIDFIETHNSLKTKTVKIVPLNESVVPFENTKGDNVPEWWTAYNKIKHDGFKERKRANLNNVMSSLSALFLLHCLNWNNLRSTLLKYVMVGVTDFGLSTIEYNPNKSVASGFRIIRTPNFRYFLFEYEKD